MSRSTRRSTICKFTGNETSAVFKLASVGTRRKAAPPKFQTQSQFAMGLSRLTALAQSTEHFAIGV
jgi:hypothetical protein